MTVGSAILINLNWRPDFNLNVMWTKFVLVAGLVAASTQAYTAKGNDHILFEKFDYTNQTMAELGFPEENFSPSNFYTVSIVEKQRVVGERQSRTCRSS